MKSNLTKVTFVLLSGHFSSGVRIWDRGRWGRMPWRRSLLRSVKTPRVAVGEVAAEGVVEVWQPPSKSRTLETLPRHHPSPWTPARKAHRST